MFHTHLRQATRPDHERVDTVFGRFDLTDPDDYRQFLLAHARALLPVEAWLRASDGGPPGGYEARANALRADLAALGCAAPEQGRLDWPDQPAARWGAAYVVEGSRLGGQILARCVADGLPRAYLAAAHAPGAWRAFLSAMDRAAAAGGAAWRADAIASARATFALFAAAGTARAGRVGVGA